MGDKLANKIPMKLVHSIAAAIFTLMGVATLMGLGLDHILVSLKLF
jgi:putative Ca2+/H+ antiporter (TMEM165/GDT1 family)